MILSESLKIKGEIVFFRSRQHTTDDGGSETLASSVGYQGESESVQTDEMSSRHQQLPGGRSVGNKFTANVNKKGQANIADGDVLVGHAFGERPLLADDELDVDYSCRMPINSSGGPLPRAGAKTSRLPVSLPFR